MTKQPHSSESPYRMSWTKTYTEQIRTTIDCSDGKIIEVTNWISIPGLVL